MWPPPGKRYRAALLLAYLVSGLVLVGALLVLFVDTAQGARVLLASSLLTTILASGVAVMRRRQALQARVARQSSELQAGAGPVPRPVPARHPGLGPGALALESDVLRFEGSKVERLGMVALHGLDLNRAGAWQVISRAFRPWFARSSLRDYAARPRRLVVMREQVVACAGFQGLATGPELVIGFRPAEGQCIQWEALFLVQPTPGFFPQPSDDPAPWVSALQPSGTERSGQQQAARARRRIHRRLALADAVVGVSAAAVPLLILVSLLLGATVIGDNPVAGSFALVLAGIGLMTSALVAIIAWLSYL